MATECTVTTESQFEVLDAIPTPIIRSYREQPIMLLTLRPSGRKNSLAAQRTSDPIFILHSPIDTMR